MKVHNALVDEDGVKWEFTYDEDVTYTRDPQTDEIINVGTVVRELRYRLEGASTGWLALPSWADIADEWKINLCLFDEDEETGELTFWKVET